MASVPRILSAGVSLLAMSRVRKPSFNTLSTAAMMASASAFRPNEISNNNAAESTEANGLATPLPVMSCAEPWIGS